MSTTSYYDITLVNDGTVDWGSVLNEALSRITEILVRNQRPSAVNLTWGDLTNGHYVACDGAKISFTGDVEFSGQPLTNIVCEQGTSYPAAPTLGQLFYRTDTSIFYVYDGGWDALGAVTAGAVAAAGALMDTELTNKGEIIVRGNGGVGSRDVIDPSAADGYLMLSDSTTATGWALTALGAALFNNMGAVGDLYVGRGAGSGSNLSVGPDGYRLVADSTHVSGMRWKSASATLGAIFTAKGDILVGTGAEASVAVPAGLDGKVLVTDSTKAAGVDWMDPDTVVASNQLFLSMNFM